MDTTYIFKDIGSVPLHKNRFTHRVWGEVKNRVDKKYLVWPIFSSRGIDSQKFSDLFFLYIKKKIKIDTTHIFKLRGINFNCLVTRELKLYNIR